MLLMILFTQCNILCEDVDVFKSVWETRIPLNVSAFVPRVVQDRIQT